MQKRFVEHMARTGDQAYSALKAGYADPSGGTYAMRSETVRDQIAALRRSRALRSLTIALDTFETVAQSRAEKGSARVAAGRELYKASGAAEAPVEDTRELHDMSLADLAKLAEQAPGLLERLKIIEASAEPAPSSSSVLD